MVPHQTKHFLQQDKPSQVRRSNGFSLIELLIVIAIIGILSMVGVMALKGLNNPLSDESSRLNQQLRQVRTRAILSTSAIKLELKSGSTTQLLAKRAKSCSAIATDWTDVSELNITLVSDVTFGSVGILCFEPRGTTSGASAIELSYQTKSRWLDIYTAGAVVPRASL
jgi:prepilin-type N-terminal cleavage/methylation domain-containing protein